jgi:hypothetical protein
MRKRLAEAIVLFAALSIFAGRSPVAQESGPPRINVTVDLVQLMPPASNRKIPARACLPANSVRW